jgi:hypothetical protein
MGLRSLRATCPNCGGKIHTRPMGLGHLTWANSWVFAQTGTECQHCNVPLTGKITPGGMAVLDEAKPVVSRQPEVLPPGAGWAPDPALRYRRRYFDGRFWTDRVQDGQGNELVDPKKVKTPR